MMWHGLKELSNWLTNILRVQNTLSWSTLYQCRSYHIATCFYGFERFIPSLLHLNLSVHKTNHCLCNSYHIYIPFVRTTIAKNSFYYHTKVLDQSLYSSTTLATFKSRYFSLTSSHALLLHSFVNCCSFRLFLLIVTLKTSLYVADITFLSKDHF